MYNIEEIKSAFLGLIGWRNNPDDSSGSWQLNEMTTSSSGLFYNDVHPILTFDNLQSISTRFGDIESSSAEINAAFTDWLKQKTEAGIVEAISTWFNEKSGLGTATNLLEQTDLFKTTNNFTDLTVSEGKIVGHRFTPYTSKNLSLKIEKIHVQFDTNQVVQIHLFQSGKKAPIQSVNVNYTGSGSVQSETVNWILKGGSSYFLAYNQDLVLGSAINGVYDYKFSGSQVAFPSGRFFEVCAFNADVDSILELWDLKKNNYTIATNYGLNASLSVLCDYTDFIISQKDLFKMLIYYHVAAKLMREIAFNPNSRLNRNAENVNRNEVIYEIDGDSQGRNRHTVFGRYERALNSIQFNSSNIDPLCLPCKKKGIKMTSTGPY